MTEESFTEFILSCCNSSNIIERISKTVKLAGVGDATEGVFKIAGDNDIERIFEMAGGATKSILEVAEVGDATDRV